ncbi:MAG: sugar phosphate nucleotidyltransferase [Anaerolineae bacterium]|nr:sugar phosphate nucleotidyltransferase [Anaerolineae bacterium]
MSENYYAVILAGGSGTRLWPLSRQDRPKQMLTLVGDRTLFQATSDRLKKLFPPERILVVTAKDQADQLQAQCPELPVENFLLETAPRGSASAIGLAAAVLQKRNAQAVMASVNSDHFIEDEALFLQVLRAAEKAAQEEYLVTLGITPQYAATGFGYIQRGESLGEFEDMAVFRAKKFIEKPDQMTAEALVAGKEHAWNSGNFVWKTEVVLREFSRQMPALHAALIEIAAAWGSPEQDETLHRVWPKLANETIDYGIMENAERVAVIPVAGLGWNDIGSWSSLFEVLPGNKDGNIVNCESHISINSQNSLVHVEGSPRMVVTIGVQDLVIVDTGDVLMVCAKDSAQDVRQVIEEIKARKLQGYL